MTSPYPWQLAQWERFLRHYRNDRLPHAYLLHGPQGTGKQDFAEAAARMLLCEHPDQDRPCGECKSCQLVEGGTHPDYVRIQPETEGKAIKIDQIRDLIQVLSLSPHFGGYRLVLISPAEQMNLAAANSLLKTLEEPRDKTLIMLVTSQLSRLPATIRSRCQMLWFAMPDEAGALDWLQYTLGHHSSAAQLLMLANGAPLHARRLADDDTVRLRQQYLQDLQALAEGGKQALAVAAEWLKQVPGKPLEWLHQWVCDMIRIKGGDEGFVINQDMMSQLQSLADTIDLKRLYHFLDKVSEVRRLRDTSANELLLLEGLLLSWTYLQDMKQQETA